MPYKKILLATDGSDHALHAAAQTAMLAKHMQAEVEVLSVAVIHPMYGGLHLGAVGAEGMEEDAKRAAEAACNDTAEKLKAEGIPVTTVVSLAMGNPADAICREAEEFGADLIVVGSRGLGRTGSLVMGSVSSQVIHCSSVPVLVVR